VKPTPTSYVEPTSTFYETLTYNGYTYNVVQIGNQYWLAENLRTTKYNDGTDISFITDTDEWSNATAGAYCIYGNKESNLSGYGCLYNFDAVKSGKLAPDDWRVATDDDWEQLVNNCLNYCGNLNEVCRRLISTNGLVGNGGKKCCQSEINNAVNYGYGFGACFGGCRSENGFCSELGRNGYYWTLSEQTNNEACVYKITNSTINKLNANQKTGYSVRLIKCK
jgi:uncharacterized protein (TIGR02145 family)